MYRYNRILFSHEKKEVLPFVTPWINWEGIMLSEISKYYMMSLIYKIFKKKKSNFIETEKKIVVARG